jgi:NADH-quinone oxidoreductase subunit L
VPTIVAGYVNVSFSGGPSAWTRFFGTLFPEDYNVAGIVLPISEFASTCIVLALVALGIVVAYLRYGAPAVQLAAIERLRVETIRMPQALRHAFWFDDLIAIAIVRPAQALGYAIARFIDPHVIDAAVRDMVWLAGALGVIARKLQTGLVRGYALTIVIGAAAFIAYFATLGLNR